MDINDSTAVIVITYSEGKFFTQLKLSEWRQMSALWFEYMLIYITWLLQWQWIQSSWVSCTVCKNVGVSDISFLFLIFDWWQWCV